MTHTSDNGLTGNEVKVSRYVLATNRNTVDSPPRANLSSMSVIGTTSARLTLRRRQEVCVLGATGSVGASTLDVIARNPDRYRVFALSGFSNLLLLEKQCLLHQPTYVVVPGADVRDALQKQLTAAGVETRVLEGQDGLHFIASHPDVDTVVAAIVGAAGLRATLGAVSAGKKILLANKEALVMSGGLFMQAVRDNGAILLPIDSEHNAISQCLPSRHAGNLSDVGVRRILLTASGGPFREMSLAELHSVTPEQACAHPTWSMGRKISVDSATLMNKGLELIEACWLFNASPQHVEVVIHPQSIVHSLVDYVDGSMLAHMSNPDMRIPISHALAWPQRIESGVGALDLFKVARLDFQAPDETRFPCLTLARHAAREGGTAPALLNAANEVAVQAFLSRRIGFTQIAEVIDTVLQQEPSVAASSLDCVLDADAAARRRADKWLEHNVR